MKTYKWLMAVALILCLTAPVIAGNGPGGPGGGGGGDIPDTGELYGDLYVILRNENGVPILSGDGCIQPISAVDGTTIIDTYDGAWTFSVTEGEPFGLPTYTDTAGDLVECELTEAMADWVQAVDFGRLNLGRSPESVLAHAFDEAINKLNLATAIRLDPSGRLVLTLPDAETGALVDKTIDAPAENLALYVEMMIDGDWITEDTTTDTKGNRPGEKGPPEGDGPSTEPRPVLNCYDADGNDTVTKDRLDDLGFGELCDSARTNEDLTETELLLAASLLAAAADKTGEITLDKVVYINSIYGINQAGSVPGEEEGKTYFDFGSFHNDDENPYNRGVVYGGRSSGLCNPGWIWVLQPELVGGAEILNHFEAQCMETMGYVNDPDLNINAVHFTDMREEYKTEGIADYPAFTSNVRGFAQAADDALQVLEYIHNYKVPEVLYPPEVTSP